MEIPKFHSSGEGPIPEKNRPVWENPDSPLFIEWYLKESKRSESETRDGFEEFLRRVEKGQAKVPTDEAIARYKLDDLR